MQISFSWTDTLEDSKSSVQDSSWNFERANVLYNMVAVEVGSSNSGLWFAVGETQRERETETDR